MTTPIRPSIPTLTRVEATTVRATAPGLGGRFQQALSDSAHVVLGGLEAVAGAVPGGSVVTAAVRGASGAPGTIGGVGGASGALTGSSGGSGAESVEAPGGVDAQAGSVESALAQSADQNLYFLKLQEQLQSENRRYSALSNVLKARHETVKNAIGNIR
jgi:hypothetical protein